MIGAGFCITPLNFWTACFSLLVMHFAKNSGYWGFRRAIHPIAAWDSHRCGKKNYECGKTM